MPLTLEELQEIQADAMADDVTIDFEKMQLWSKEEATEFFESGGTTVPGAPPPAAPTPPPPPPPHPKLPRASDEDFKAWFPIAAKENKQNPKFRIVAFHNAGSAESVYTGRGMRNPNDNAFVQHCKDNDGELLACQLPGREQRRNEPRHRTLRPYCEALFPVLAPLLQEDVPYAVVSHSMGTWMSYEWMRLCAEKNVPLPKMWAVSGFPAPDIPEAERPWNKNEGMGDPQFMDEARLWDVNEIVFQGPNWKQFSPMMRDDFTLFDSYQFTPPPAHIGPAFPIPILARYATKDRRCKKHHLEMWKRFTTEADAFHILETPGNHLFFYDVPARDTWMKSILKKLPAAFCPDKVKG